MRFLAVHIFEDPKLTERFLPLSLLKGLDDLRLGASTLKDKQVQAFGSLPIKNLRGQTCHEDLCPENTLFVSSAAWVSRSLKQQLENLEPGQSLWQKRDLVAFLCPAGQNVQAAQSEPQKAKQVSDALLAYPWDIQRLNARAIVDDLEDLKDGFWYGSEDLQALGTVRCFGSHKAYVPKGLKIFGDLTLITTDGPVLIEPGVSMKGSCLIEGPAVISAESQISSAQIRPGTSIGPQCRISGEVSASVFQGFSNKAHAGFVGNTYVGSWVNFGAMSTVSNLKNNYKTVSMPCGLSALDSGILHLGAFICDYVTLGIGSLVPCGARIGSAVNFYGGGMMPKDTHSFAWGEGQALQVYDFDKALENFARMMQRRSQEMSEEQVRCLKNLYDARESYVR